MRVWVSVCVAREMERHGLNIKMKERAEVHWMGEAWTVKIGVFDVGAWRARGEHPEIS